MTGISFHPIDDPGVVRAWDELADHTGAAPFTRPGWFAAWARAFDGRVELATVGDGALEAALPIVRRRTAVLSPVNGETPDLHVLAASQQARDRILAGLLERGSVELLKVGPEEAEAVSSLAVRHRVLSEIMQRSPYIDVTGSWEEYEASLRSKFRKELRRSARRLGEAGEVSIDYHSDEDDLGSLLEDAFDVEASQWKADEGTAISSRSNTRSFYEAVAQWAAHRGWLRLWFLRLDGTAVAFALDLATERAYFGLKVGYDPRFARFSPGLLLQDDTVRYAFEQELDRFEFLGADERYKLNWTNTCRERLAVRAYARDAHGTLGWLKRAVARPAVHRLRRVAGRAG